MQGIDVKKERQNAAIRTYFDEKSICDNSKGLLMSVSADKWHALIVIRDGIFQDE